jgi:GTP-binding protein HflX
MAEISHLIARQLGILVTREGVISHVIVGDAGGIFIPELGDHPLGRNPLRGLRLIHTHLKNEPLTKDDLTDLALLRLDYVAAIGVKDGRPDKLFTAHLTPQSGETPYEVHPPVNFHEHSLDFRAFINSLEEEMERRRGRAAGESRESAILVSVSTRPRGEQEESLDELEELAYASDILVLGKVVQRPHDINPKHLLGIGKLKDLIIDALGKGATLLVFDQNLTPSQGRFIAELTEIKVIDRTQLILDIFARRAHSRDGKVQVELAQLKYRLSRLTGKGTAMSRLMGGVGGRGPGEMKLEIDRRRVRDRITLLTQELKKLEKARSQRKQHRLKTGLPIVSIIGYTNAGKSTLLNALTESSTFVENKMFATLDTASRRLRFPRERDVIITDTVGFIKDLPDDLVAAFKATLEELEDADLLLHVVDTSNPRFQQQIDSVLAILEKLSLDQKPRLTIFNKSDLASPEETCNQAIRYDAISVSALDKSTLTPLLNAIEERIFYNKIASGI